MNVNYDRVCRLCLSSRGEILPIFPTTSSDDSEPPVLASKIKECVSVQINENDDLPTNVCRKCMDNVNNWHIFKTVCERTQNKLHSLIKKDGSQLEEVKVKSEPLSDEAYHDGVVIDGSYPDGEQPVPSKLQPEGPPILASLGLTPRSDKGVESEKDDDEDEEEELPAAPSPSYGKAPAMPEVSITVMRPTGETLRARQGIQQLASKDCLVCGRSYRYSHNARRHELTSHAFDRYTNKVANKKTSHMQPKPKLRPNPFNPKARLMPNPISHKMHLIPKPVPHRVVPQKPAPPPRPIGIPIKHSKTPQNNLPYPLRIKALKDLQIKKKEPQILKTLLTSKPEVLVSEPEIMNSAPESPETLISEPEIASFQVEAILSEPDGYDQQNDEVDGEIHNNQSHPYDTVDMGSDNEIEIARENEKAANETQNERDDQDEENMDHDGKDVEDDHDDGKEDAAEDCPDDENNEENAESKVEDETKEDDQEGEDHENHEQDQEANTEENDEYEDEIPPAEIAPMVELNEDMQTNSYVSEQNEEEEDLDITADPNENIDADDGVKELDPNKLYVTKTQRDFISKYRDIIEQVNTKRCLCCDKEHPRRKAVIQHLQKNGHKVPKHTCYNCVVTFSHIGALLSHMRQNACTNLWKIIYNENGITDDLVLEKGPRSLKAQFKDILNARSYGCKLCPAKFQLKQFITKHILDCHEDGQSGVPTVCVHCGNRFKDKNILKRHVRSAECLIYVHCEICPEKFGNLQEFTEHALATHTDNVDQDNSNKCVDGRPTDCPLCGNKSSTYPGLVKHLKLYHDEDKPHYCQHCDSKFEQANDLNNHIYKAHSDLSGAPIIEPDMSLVKEEAEEYHYSCTECNAIFETVDAWTDHQVAEHNQVAHHCDQCDKKFLRPSELAEHKNTHLRVKFYPCSVCSNSYSTPQKLSDHVQQMHPGAAAAAYAAADTEFFCTICIRPFKSRQAYSNHMRIHSKVPTTNRRPQDPKSFSPQIIGKSIKMTKIQQGFIFKPNAPNVPNAPYSCDICGKGFMHKKNIWKHKKVLHADLVGDRNDSEENTMQASTEEDEYNVDENGIALSTPQFNSFNFANFANNTQPTQSEVYTCDICYQRFSFREGLRKHKRAKHGVVNPSTSNSSETQTQATPSDGNSSRSNCTICKISFTDKRSYYRHRKNVHKSTAQMCKICGKPLSSTLELYEHLKAAHARELLGYNANQGSSKTQDILVPEVELGYDGDQDSVDPSVDYQAKYPCDTCGKQFVGLLALQNHQCITQITPQPSTFDCEICHKSYTSIAALKSHRGWHLRSPDGKAAANNSGLWMPQHKVTNKVSKHEVVDPSQLARTTLSAPAAAAAAAPKRRLPPEVEVTVVNPNKKMRSDDSVDMESQNASGAPDDRYCTMCDKEFTKRAAYQRHMDEVHQPNSVFCPVCDKSFTRKSTLLVHMKKHYEGGEGGSAAAPAEEEEGACDVCGAQFDSAAALRAHRARHHGEDESSRESEDEAAAPCGEFTCAQCGDGVATPRDLLAHRTMHATPTKYFCNICKVYFARALDLSSHTRARHSDTDKSAMFPCAMCDRFYMNKKSLQRHIEMAH